MQTQIMAVQSSAVGWLQKCRNMTKTTPGIMRLLQAGLLMCTVMLAIFSWGYYNHLESTTRTIANDTVPSIVAAEKTRATLAEAHASVINSFVSHVNSEDNWDSYVSNMRMAHDALLSAAQNITYGDEERKPIYTMMENLAQYDRLVGDARARGSYGASMREADKLMATVILPAAEQLDKINVKHMDGTYSDYKASGSSEALIMGFAAVALLGILVLTQFYLFKATKRMVNLPLALATLGFIAAVVASGTQLLSAEHSMKVAKEDAFDSVHNLWKARATAAEALTSESLYMLEAGNSQQRNKYITAFQTKSDSLLAIKPENLYRALDSHTPIKGLLGEELTSVAFDGEKEAATSVVMNWNAYRAVDQRMRDVAAQRNHDYTPDEVMIQSSLSFGAFDNSLDKALSINQYSYETEIANSFKNLEKMALFMLVSIVSVLVGGLIGFRSRLNEYRF